jgi:hypothetical protein
MSRNQIIGRLEKLEQRQPGNSYSGVDHFIWDGPKDDAALAEAERTAEVSGRLLIVRRIVDPPQRNPSSDLKGRVACNHNDS